LSLNPAVSQKYNLGPVKSWVADAAYSIGGKFNVKTIYGWRAHDTFPDHPSGHALDFMITSKSQGQAIADYLQQNAGALGVKYIIWNRQVWEASGKPVAGWHPYTSTSNPHTDHVHVTFNDQPGQGGVVAATDVSASTAATSSGPSTSPDCAWGAHIPVAGDTCVFSKVQVRNMLALLIISGGIVVGLAGIAFMVVQIF
jgi:hypothetical protein